MRSSAAECAVQTGGNPVGFAGCAVGRLTLKELGQCFQGQIRKERFGPNNTIVLALTNAFNDLTKGPGENNEVVKALKSNSEWTGGPNSSQLIGGPNSMINMDKFGVVLTRS